MYYKSTDNMYNIYIFMYIDVSYYIVDIILSYYPTT